MFLHPLPDAGGELDFLRGFFKPVDLRDRVREPVGLGELHQRLVFDHVGSDGESEGRHHAKRHQRLRAE